MREIINRLKDIEEVDRLLVAGKKALHAARDAYGGAKRLRKMLSKPIILSCYPLIISAIQKYNETHTEVRICHSPLHVEIAGSSPGFKLLVHLVGADDKELKNMLSEKGFDQIEHELKMLIAQSFGEHGNPLRLIELRAPRRYFAKGD